MPSETTQRWDEDGGKDEFKDGKIDLDTSEAIEEATDTRLLNSEEEDDHDERIEEQAESYADHVEEEDQPERIGVVETGVFTVIQPIQIHRKMAAAPNAARIGWVYVVGFSFMYAVLSLILALRGFVPYVDPFLPIKPKNYYLAQAIFNVPASIAIVGMGFGIVYAVCRLFGSSVRPGALWGTFASTLVIPCFVFTWLPELFHSIFAEPNGHFYPFTGETIDFYRLAVVLPIFLALYSTLGMYGCAGLKWWQTPIASLPAAGLVGALNMIVKR